MRPTSGSRSPNVSRSAPSAAEADTRPSSKASAGPTLATSMPLPTSARNSRRLRCDMVLLPWGTGSRGRRSPAPVVEEIDRTVILATQLINAAALHDCLGKAWAVPEQFGSRLLYLALRRCQITSLEPDGPPSPARRANKVSLAD